MDQNWPKWLKTYQVQQRDKQDHHSTQFKAFSINLTYKVQMLAKGGYIWPKMIKFLPILFNFGWFFGQNWPNLTCSRPVYVLFMQNSNSWLETVWKSGLVWLSRPLDTVLAIWSNIWPIFVQTWPNLTVFGPNFDILCKIHTQGLKLHEKMALFGPLGLLIRFWPFGPILDFYGQ